MKRTTPKKQRALHNILYKGMALAIVVGCWSCTFERENQKLLANEGKANQPRWTTLKKISTAAFSDSTAQELVNICTVEKEIALLALSQGVSDQTKDRAVHSLELQTEYLDLLADSSTHADFMIDFTLTDEAVTVYNRLNGSPSNEFESNYLAILDSLEHEKSKFNLQVEQFVVMSIH